MRIPANTTGPRLAAIPLEEEDAVSLLDINAMEPVIRINEEEDTLFLEEDNEDLSDVYTEMIEDGIIPKDEEEDTPPEAGTPPYDAPPYMGDPYRGEPYPMDAPYPAAPYPSIPAAPAPQAESNPSEAAPAPAASPETPSQKPQTNDPLEEKEEVEPRLDIAGMMNYLFTLSHDLPEEKRQVLIDKAIPLKMASVVKRLSGGKHFKEKVSGYDRRNPDPKRLSYKLESRMKESLSAFRNLTQEHPDNLISSAFTKKMDELMTKIKPYF